MNQIDRKITEELTQIASKLNINLSLRKNSDTEDIEEIQEVKPHKKVEKRKSELEILLEKLQIESDWKVLICLIQVKSELI